MAVVNDLYKMIQEKMQVLLFPYQGRFVQLVIKEVLYREKDHDEIVGYFEPVQAGARVETCAEPGEIICLVFLKGFTGVEIELFHPNVCMPGGFCHERVNGRCKRTI